MRPAGCRGAGFRWRVLRDDRVHDPGAQGLGRRGGDASVILALGDLQAAAGALGGLVLECHRSAVGSGVGFGYGSERPPPAAASDEPLLFHLRCRSGTGDWAARGAMASSAGRAMKTIS